MPGDHIPLVLARLPFDGTYPLTGRFGQVDDGWTPARPHLGEDWGLPLGTPVVCDVAAHHEVRVHAVHRPGDGWGDGSFGICVVLDVRQTPYYLLYAHLSALKVVAGETVALGTVLGLSGQTGAVTGAHLHQQISDSPDFPRDLARAWAASSFRGHGGIDPTRALEERVAALERIVGGREAGNYDLLRSVQAIQESLSNHRHEIGGPIL